VGGFEGGLVVVVVGDLVVVGGFVGGLVVVVFLVVVVGGFVGWIVVVVGGLVPPEGQTVGSNHFKSSIFSGVSA
jgi:hypothetical protein